LIALYQFGSVDGKRYARTRDAANGRDRFSVWDIWSITCGSCGEGVAADVVVGWPTTGNPTTQEANARSTTLWLQCPKCKEGSVKLKDGSVFPTASAGNVVANVPDDVAAAWREARTTHAVAAYTACEMMSRKILMHIAVDRANAQPGDTFVSYIDQLESAGHIPTDLKPVVDLIRVRGKVANHALPASSEQDSKTTLAITEYLLKGMYELPGLVP
jgi:hypothetical protein